MARREYINREAREYRNHEEVHDAEPLEKRGCEPARKAVQVMNARFYIGLGPPI
jgi:hypothetical protein